MSRWAITLPIVARRSPAISTPPLKVTATIVVPCGAWTWLPSGNFRPEGSNSGAWARRKSVNDDDPGVKYAGGSDADGYRPDELFSMCGFVSCPRVGWLAAVTAYS